MSLHQITATRLVVSPTVVLVESAARKVIGNLPTLRRTMSTDRDLPIIPHSIIIVLSKKQVFDAISYFNQIYHIVFFFTEPDRMSSGKLSEVRYRITDNIIN